MSYGACMYTAVNETQRTFMLLKYKTASDELTLTQH